MRRISKIIIISIVILTVFCLIGFCLTGCGGFPKESDNEPVASGEAASSNPEEQEQPEETEQMPAVRVQRNDENDPVIAMTAEDFLEAWNSACGRDDKPNLLLPTLNEFNTYVADEAIHSDHQTRHYVYAPGDERFCPVLDIYVTESSGELLQVDLTYDEHNYREESWKLHEEMCVAALQVLLQDMSTEELRELCLEVNELGAKNVFPHEQVYEPHTVPGALISRNGIGVYSYFATGYRSHFCIIPVDGTRLEEFKEAGTEIREMA